MIGSLKEAIAAARAGDREGAQLLVAEYIEDNPNDPQAWYLLSQLVDSDARRAAYLNKTLVIDPSHERARAEFSTLPTEVIDELADSSMTPVEQPIATVAAAAQPISTEAPEWLRPLGAEPAPQPTSSLTPVADTLPPSGQVTPATPQPAAPAEKQVTKRQSNSWLVVLWVLLALVTVLVLVLLGYLLLG